MHIRTKGRIAGLAIFGAAFLATNAFPSTGPVSAATGDDVVLYSGGDDRMIAAQDAAQKHFSRFLDHVLNDLGQARADAAVKVAIPLEGDAGTEVIWVTPFAIRDGLFIGALANDPHFLTGLFAGDVIAFDGNQVRDWSFYGPDGKMYGSYTTRVILADLTPNHAARIRALLSPDPLPSDW